MTGWTWLSERPDRRGPSLSVALTSTATASLETWLTRRLQAGGIIERTIEEPVPGTSVWIDEFLIDFAPLDALGDPANLLVVPKETFRDPSMLKQLARIWKERLTDKLVLVGSASKGSAVDYFAVPDRTAPVPGVLVQAAAVYTLASAPLYELSSWARPLLDLALSLFVFGVLAIAQVRYRRGDMRLAVDRLRAILIGLAVTVVLFSSLLVHSSRIVWDDFLIVTLMLLAHHRLEESSVRLWNWLLDAVPAGLRAVLFEDDRGRRQ